MIVNVCVRIIDMIPARGGFQLGIRCAAPTPGSALDYISRVLAHERRRALNFNVTEHPTAEWTATQIVQAFSRDTAPRYLLRDRDRIDGDTFRAQAAGMQITEVLTAAINEITHRLN